MSMEPIPETREAVDELEAFADEDLLEHLLDAARQVRELVPDCVGLSLTTVEHGVTFTLVASDVEIAILDALQYVDDGPCVEAVGGVDPREFNDQDFAEQGWQIFAQGTAAKGVKSTLTLPILNGERVTGSVNLYGASRRAFGGLHEQIAAIFDAWAPGAVSNADLSFETRRRATQAPEDLRAGARIRAAVGVIIAALDVGEEDARGLLRDAALCAGVSELRVAEALIRARYESGGGRGE